MVVGYWVKVRGLHGRSKRGGKEKKKRGVIPTVTTNADFKHPGAKAVSSRHTETLINRVFRGAHEDIAGGCKAVRRDAFNLHVFHKG